MAFARARQVFLGVHQASGTPVDVSFAWLPFEDEALNASQTCDDGGVRIRSPLVLHGATMNIDRVRRVVKQFAEVLDDPERLEALERLIRKVEGKR